MLGYINKLIILCCCFKVAVISANPQDKIQQPTISYLMSLQLPDASWLLLFKELKQQSNNYQVVLAGVIPGYNLKQTLLVIKKRFSAMLEQLGLTWQDVKLQIDPQPFKTHQITQVPVIISGSQICYGVIVIAACDKQGKLVTLNEVDPTLIWQQQLTTLQQVDPAVSFNGLANTYLKQWQLPKKGQLFSFPKEFNLSTSNFQAADDHHLKPNLMILNFKSWWQIVQWLDNYQPAQDWTIYTVVNWPTQVIQLPEVLQTSQDSLNPTKQTANQLWQSWQLLSYLAAQQNIKLFWLPNQFPNSLYQELNHLDSGFYLLKQQANLTISFTPWASCND